MRTAVLAAVTLDVTGGGVASVSRLVWRAFQQRWGEAGRLVELLPPAPPTLHPSALRRVRFGVELLRERLLGDPWIFFGHLGLARALGPVPRGRRPPYVLFLHGVEAWRPLRPRERAVIDEAAVVLANSAFTRARVIEHNPGLERAIHVCHLALEPDAAAGVPDEQELWRARQDRPPTVLMVGRLASTERYKGHDQVIEAWPFVRRVVPDARLEIVGDGDDRPRLETKAAALGLSQAVRFTGFVDNRGRAAAYEQAHAFALPSRGEGFGLVYLEAMAHALPCIGSRDDAAGEVIEDGRSGWLVRQDDHRALVERLVGVLREPEIARQMGLAGRDRVRTKFGYATFRDRLYTLLDETFEGTMPGYLERDIA